MKAFGLPTNMLLFSCAGTIEFGRVIRERNVERKPFITAATLFLCCCTAAHPALAWQDDPSVATLVGTANQLREALKDREALEQYLRVLAIEPNHFEALSGAAYLYGKVGSHLDRKEEQENYFEEALLLAERAIEQATDNSESNFVMAWAYGGIAMISSVRKKSRQVSMFMTTSIVCWNSAKTMTVPGTYLGT